MHTIGRSSFPRFAPGPRRSIGSGFGAWARSISSRYRRATAWLLLPARRFLRPALPLPGEHIVERLRTVVHRLAPRIQLRVHREAGGVIRLPRAFFPQVPAAAVVRPRLARTGTRSSAAPTPPIRVERVIQAGFGATRILPRTTGSHADDPLGSPGAGTAEGTSAVRRVHGRHERIEHRIDSYRTRRLVHRTERVEERSLVRARRILKRSKERPAASDRRPADASYPAHTDRPSPGPLARGSAGARSPHGAAAGQIDINSLTDQVVRRIDGRFLAWRERTGRI
ncbi:MAG: hypothetical protein ACE5GX_01845 [Thermoanaerobaculia bacterium]